MSPACDGHHPLGRHASVPLKRWLRDLGAASLVAIAGWTLGCSACGGGAAQRAESASAPSVAASSGSDDEASPPDLQLELPRPLSVSATSTAMEGATGATPTRLLLFGDSGTNDSQQRDVANGMARQCATQVCDAAVLVGDIIYPDGLGDADDPMALTHFEDHYRGLGAPLWLALGNHDYHRDPNAWIARYGTQGSRAGKFPAHMPARYYTVSLGAVRLVVLDTNRLDDDQGAWLDAVLREAAARGDRWIVAAGHHPWRSYGMHRHAEPAMAAFYQRHLCGKVDVFVAGHDHDKQLLRGPCDVALVVSGTAGKLRPVGRGDETLFALSSPGWARLEVRGAEAVLTFHAADGALERRARLQRRPRQ